MRKVICFIVVMVVLGGMSGSSWATCQADSKIVDGLTSLCSDCIFPFKIATVEVWPGSADNEMAFGGGDTGVCICGKEDCYPSFTAMGITMSYWAPNRVAETVKDAWCFPYIGVDMTSMNENTFLKGTNTVDSKGTKETGHTFAQGHFWENYIWAEVMRRLGMAGCDKGGEKEDKVQIGWFTELDPLWPDSVLSAIIEPEALLFANEIAQLACVAQAISSLVPGGFDLPMLFWCIGGGSAYPLAGSIAQPDYVQANQRLAARMVYRMSRIMLECDMALDACKCWTIPIWFEAHFRIQELGPVAAATCNTLGRSDIIWGSGMNPPYQGDNFIWVLYRKSVCCAFMQCLG